MALHRAAGVGDLDTVLYRLQIRDDVDGIDEYGWTPLMQACGSGQHECARALTDAGAAVDEVVDGGLTALMWACFLGKCGCARTLIDASAAVDLVSNLGQTPIMYACDMGQRECAQALIDAGAAVDEVNNVGKTALMYACEVDSRECAQALIDAGAAVDVVDNGGLTALMKTCGLGHHECAQALIDAQADLELTNRDGKNALMIACESPPSYLTQSERQGRIRCAVALLAATAPIQETDFSDRVASLKFACGRLQLIEVVLASPHVIEDAPPLVSVRDLQTDAQGVFVNFASDMLAIAKLPKPKAPSTVGPAGSLPSAASEVE